MDKFIYVLIFVYNIIFIRDFFIKKNYFGLGLIINIAVNFNFLLYLLGWSEFLNVKTYTGTYVLLASTIIIAMVVMIYSKSPVDKLLEGKNRIVLKPVKLNIGKYNVDLYVLINMIYILLFLTENFIGSGNIAPNLFGIDIHTYSAPIISFFTRALFVMIIFNFLSFTSFKKKYFLLFIVIDLALFLVLRGARFNAFMSVFQFTLFIFIYYFDVVKRHLGKFLIVTSLLVIVIFSLGVTIGNNRVEEQYGHLEEDYTYTSLIKYTGPEDPLGIIPWYYGYFPMSYGNLNNSVNLIDEKEVHTFGLYTMRPIFVGAFQFDNLIPNYKDIDYTRQFYKINTTAATVTTGFMEFYLDFGYFSFISILIYLLIGLFFYNQIRKNIYYSVFYSAYAINWLLMSFQNTMIEVITWYTLLYLFLIKKFLVENNDNKLLSRE